MKYGIANRLGQPSVADAIRILTHAIASGVTSLDTARAYGESERVIGQALKQVGTDKVTVLTKLGALEHLTGEVSDAVLYREIDASIDASCHALGLKSLHTVMLHRCAHLRAYDGRIWRRLQQHKAAGVIGRLGVSVYDPTEALVAFATEGIEHIQLPFNILDWRWVAAGVPAARLRRPQVLVHVRSVFLQGLLVTSPSAWPALEGVDSQAIVAELEACAQSLGLASRAELCMAFALSQGWVDQVVIGVESLPQLQENLRLADRSRLSDADCMAVCSRLPRVPLPLLNPSLWSRCAQVRS